MMKISAPGAAAVLLFTPLTSLSAQSPELANEIKMVRSLVKDLRFPELAQHEVQRLKKSYQESGEFKLVSQLDIEVSLEGAKVHPDRATRRELYKQALEQSATFIDRYSAEPVAVDARTTLADACIEFGAFLNDELEIARDEDPDKVKGLEEDASKVFRQGVKAAEASQEAYMAIGGKRKIDGYVAWLRRGILLREHARAVVEHRDTLCDHARDVLEELILDVGEETILGQKALFEMSKIAEVRGNYAQAISSYNDAVDAIYTSLTDPNVSLPETAQRLMFDMMQEVFDRKALICMRQGRTEDVIKTVELARKRVQEFRTELHPMFGDSLLLTEAQVKANSGAGEEVSKALATAKEINERHPADLVGLKAKSLIRSIMSRSSTLVTGALLLDVAEGDYQTKKYDAAISGFKRAINNMDAESRKKLGFDAWTKIGRSNQNMQRYLEAAMAYSKAIELHGNDLMEADPEGAKEQLKLTANRATFCISRVLSSSEKDPVFSALSGKIAQQLKDNDVSVATARDYNEGLKAKNARDYAKAIQSFLLVKPDFDKYELALGHAIECQFRAEKFDEAKKLIADLRAHVKSTPLDEKDHDRRGYRPQALAWAHYTEGRIMYERARGKDGKPDLSKFADVEKHFLEFEATHAAAAPQQMIKVHEMLGHAYLEMGEDAKALARYEKLKAHGATIADAHRFLGAKMFNSYIAQMQSLQTEIKVTNEAGKDTGPAGRKLTEVRKRAVDLGLDYARTIGKPGYGILYMTMRVAEDLEDWPKCESAAERILKLYPDSKEPSFRQVKPVLGYALLRQSGRMREALDILKQAEEELSKGTKTSAYYDVLRYKAMALGGWPAMDADGINYTPNPGMGKPKEAYDLLWTREYNKFALNQSRTPRHSLGWYRYYLESYYFARQAQRTDPSIKETADKLLRIARSFDNFAALKGLGPEGDRIHHLFTQIK